MPTPTKTNEVTTNTPVRSKHDIQANRYYVFNETGNICVATTSDSGEVDEKVTQLFQEVAVFFAGMTRAITTTINKATNKPYTIYDYEALNNVISGSGLFVNVARENIRYESNQFGATFSKQLVEAVLGLATGEGALSFASSLVASVGSNAIEISESNSSTNTHSAAIMFICECLLGMPSITAIVVSIDAKRFTESVDVGPCFSETETHTALRLRKESYLFVPPSYIKTCAENLDFAESNPQYLQLVSWLQDLVTEAPLIIQVVEVDGNTATVLEPGGMLHTGRDYFIQGQYLPTHGISARFVSTDPHQDPATLPTITLGTTQLPGEISFTISGASLDAPLPFEIRDSAGRTVKSPGGYMVTAAPRAGALKAQAKTSTPVTT